VYEEEEWTYGDVGIWEGRKEIEESKVKDRSLERK
jgi:hypothetical protein